MIYLIKIDQATIWHLFTPFLGHRELLLITSAQGCYLETDDEDYTFERE